MNYFRKIEAACLQPALHDAIPRALALKGIAFLWIWLEGCERRKILQKRCSRCFSVSNRATDGKRRFFTLRGYAVRTAEMAAGCSASCDIPAPDRTYSCKCLQLCLCLAGCCHRAAACSMRTHTGSRPPSAPPRVCRSESGSRRG